MFEKVNPAHPDKIADRIAGAIVDLVYSKEENPKIAAEVLIGHGFCYIIIETNVSLKEEEIINIVKRINPVDYIDIHIVPQDNILAENQADIIKCGDNGIFYGLPISEEEKTLTKIAKNIYSEYPSDGKYIIDNNHLTICQSNA